MQGRHVSSFGLEGQQRQLGVSRLLAVQGEACLERGDDERPFGRVAPDRVAIVLHDQG